MRDVSPGRVAGNPVAKVRSNWVPSLHTLVKFQTIDSPTIPTQASAKFARLDDGNHRFLGSSHGSVFAQVIFHRTPLKSSGEFTDDQFDEPNTSDGYKTEKDRCWLHPLARLYHKKELP